MQDSEIDKQDDLDSETPPESAETVPDEPVPDDLIPDEPAPDNIESDEQAPDEPVPDEVEITTANVLEAILFAADEPVAPARLVDIIGTCSVKQIRQHIDELNEKYQQTGCVFRIEAIAGGYLMLTQPRFNPWLRQLIKVRSETKLSPAALETLAIIAYKQPVMRVDVEAIRGVGAGEMTRQLIEKGLVKIAGRAEELGRPLLYGTTRKFLEIFGLDSLKDLPNADTPKNNNS
jgi:segregation and condensation protein B